MNAKPESFLREKPWLQSLFALAAVAFIFLAGRLQAQTCSTASDMDTATRTALETTGKRLFDMAAKGDVFNLKQSAIPSLAANFAGIETAVIENKDAFSGATATVRPPYLLKLDGNEPAARAEFLCGVFGPQGQTANSAVFVIPNLPPGTYAIDILDLTGGSKGPYTLSFVLQQIGNDWKLGGFYAKAATVAGHDAKWYMQQADQYKAKAQVHNAWLYYLEARDLIAPVPFMSTLETDHLYDTIHNNQPKDMPVDGNTVDLTAANGKTYKLTQVFPVVVGNDLNLVVKYPYPDVSNTGQTFQENMAVMRAVLAKYPEFRSAFTAVVARAVQPDGKDYGSLMPIKDIK
ncbi:MAG TPA: hypothetical protein VMT53_02835 [Terriglobales bacterium]|nr:hypothetical protein [Terriglobales bacterium]